DHLGPRPGARNHGVGRDRGGRQPSEPRRQRRDQDGRQGRARGPPVRLVRPVVRRDRRAPARGRGGRGGVRQCQPAIDAEARPGARRVFAELRAERGRGGRIRRPAGQEGAGRHGRGGEGAGPRDGGAAAAGRGDRGRGRGGRARGGDHARAPSGVCAQSCRL
ncbi:MAG: RuvC, partial [uncultured Sphingomonadaceae bacterium]